MVMSCIPGHTWEGGVRIDQNEKLFLIGDELRNSGDSSAFLSFLSGFYELCYLIVLNLVLVTGRVRAQVMEGQAVYWH